MIVVVQIIAFKKARNCDGPPTPPPALQDGKLYWLFMAWEGSERHGKSQQEAFENRGGWMEGIPRKGEAELGQDICVPFPGHHRAT